MCRITRRKCQITSSFIMMIISLLFLTSCAYRAATFSLIASGPVDYWWIGAVVFCLPSLLLVVTNLRRLWAVSRRGGHRSPTSGTFISLFASSITMAAFGSFAIISETAAKLCIDTINTLRSDKQSNESIGADSKCIFAPDMTPDLVIITTSYLILVVLSCFLHYRRTKDFEKILDQHFGDVDRSRLTVADVSELDLRGAQLVVNLTPSQRTARDDDAIALSDKDE